MNSFFALLHQWTKPVSGIIQLKTRGSSRLNYGFKKLHLRYPFCTFSSNDESLFTSFANTNGCHNYDWNVSWTKYHKRLNRDFIFYIKRSRNLNVYVDQDTLAVLCDTFKTSDVAHIVKYPKLSNCSSEQLKETISFLHQCHIELSHLEKAPWLLWQSKDELIKKRDLILGLNIFDNLINGLGFMLFTPTLIEKYHAHFISESKEFPQHRNRIYYICDILNLPVDLFTIKLVSAWIILHMRKQKIVDIAHILKDYRIEPRNIVSDLWIFYINAEKIKNRLEILSQRSSVPPKLWVCRCPTQTFHKFCLKDRKPSGGDNVHSHEIYQHISTVLGLDVIAVKNSLGKLSLHSSVRKARKNLDILKEFSFTNEQIRRNMLALTAQTEEIEKRMKILTDLGLDSKDIPISTFKKSKKKFEAFCSARQLEQEIRLKCGIK